MSTDIGPWRIDRDDRPGMEWNNHIVEESSGNAVCFMAHSGQPDNSKHEQYASLIAAAPQLLDAAETALLLLRKGTAGWGVAKDLLNAAIHKAKETK